MELGGTSFEFARSIIETTDGGYATAGGTGSFGGPDWYFVKLNSSGAFQWSRNVRGTNGEYAWSIVQTTDGGFAAAGTTNLFGAGREDMSIVKLDVNGNTCGNAGSPSSQSGTGGIMTSPNPTVTSPNPTVTTPSPTVSTGGTVTIICVIGIQPISNEIPGSFELEQNYPNPFNPKTIINFQLPIFSFVKLTVYDVLGREVTMLVNEELKPGTYSVDWDASSSPSGVYFYKLETEDYAAAKRMVLIK